MTKHYAIELTQAQLGYGDEAKVLSIPHLQIPQGKLIGLAGLNGSGKSTLLRSIAGLQPWLSGKILLNGKDLKSYSCHTMAQEISMVLTERIGGFNMTGYDAIAAGRLPYTNLFHDLSEKDKEVVDKAMRMTGADHFSQKPLNEMSDGMYQKTMIARAIAQDTPLLLMDEPGAFLDYSSKHELFRLMVLLCHEDKRTIVVSSHELDLLLRYTDDIILLEKGNALMIPSKDASRHERMMKLSGGFL